MPNLLIIKNLRVKVDNKEIIHGLNLNIKLGEVHALLGPNGSGKSTLALVLMGHPSYTIVGGSIKLLGKNISKLLPEQRATLGIFLAFQYPQTVAGLVVEDFLRSAYNAQQVSKKLSPLNVNLFKKLLEPELKLLHIKPEFLQRNLNEGFSGGEKKRLEILQLIVLRPKLVILDETDSGLDVDALKLVADDVNRLIGPDMGVLVITHYQRLLHYLKPTHVHVMMSGRIAESGDKNLAKKVEKSGYEQFKIKDVTI